MFLFYGPKLLRYITMYYYPYLLIFHFNAVHTGTKYHDNCNSPVLTEDTMIYIA